MGNSLAKERFTIKVISETERSITRMVGDTAGKADSYECHRWGYYPTPPQPWEKPPPPDNPVTCVDTFLGAEPWLFYKSNYTRAFLGGPRVVPGGGDPNISVAYGTCTKF